MWIILTCNFTKYRFKPYCSKHQFYDNCLSNHNEHFTIIKIVPSFGKGCMMSFEIMLTEVKFPLWIHCVKVGQPGPGFSPYRLWFSPAPLYLSNWATVGVVVSNSPKRSLKTLAHLWINLTQKPWKRKTYFSTFRRNWSEGVVPCRGRRQHRVSQS